MAVLMLVSLLGASGLVAGQSQWVEPAQLPTPRDGVSAVWTGEHVFLFGGFDGSGSRQILRFDPSTGTIKVMGAQLPTARFWTSAAFDGRYAYVFAGIENDLRKVRDILRYDPEQDQLQVMGARLPEGLGGSAAFSDGRYAYVTGGHTGPNAFTDRIYRYDPATDTVATMAATLPSGRDSISAFWDGERAYIVGGHVGSEVMSDQIVAYDPQTDTATLLDAKLPSPRRNFGLWWDGQAAYVFGGALTGTISTSEIVRFSPGNGEVAVMPLALPGARANTVAAGDGERGWTFGGRTTPSGTFLSQIVGYAPRLPGVPRNVAATGGPELGVVTVTWEPPANADASGITGYRIYRRTAEAAPALLAEVGPAVTSYMDGGATMTNEYRYSVRTVAGAYESSRSAESCAAPAPAHLLPSTNTPCHLPPGWTEHTLASRQVPVTVASAPTLVRVDAGPTSDPRYYGITVRAGTVTVPVQVYTGGLVGESATVAVPAPVQTANMAVSVKVRYDPAQATCLVRALGLCALESPVGPVDTGWLLTYGPKAELVIALTAEIDGQPTTTHLRVPLVGQALA